MSNKEVQLLWYVLLAIMAVNMLGILNPSGITTKITGHFVSVPGEATWDFTEPADYTYNPSLLQVQDGAARLAVIRETISEEAEVPVTVVAASRGNAEGDDDAGDGEEEEDGEEEDDDAGESDDGEEDENEEDEDDDSTLSRILLQDGEAVTLHKGDAYLNVEFSGLLADGDTISLYLLQRNNVETDVYVCDAGTFCSAPGYGSVHFTGSEGEYAITLSGISGSVSTLAIDPPSTIKIDRVTATRKVIVSSTIPAYPVSASIETSDFAPADWGAWRTFTADAAADAEGGRIEYQYSTNGGNSWSSLQPQQNLSPIATGTLRFKAILHVENNATPILHRLGISYAVAACQEEWVAHYDTCQIDDTQIKTYQDSNGCGTALSLPEDNGTAAACNYCSYQLQNTSWSEWLNQTDCSDGEYTQQRSRAEYDANYAECYALTGLASDLWNNGENKTYLETGKLSCACQPLLENSSWSEWQNQSFCRIDGTLLQNRSTLERDANNCLADNAWWELRTLACDYCTEHNCTASGNFLPATLPQNGTTNKTIVKVDAFNATGTVLEMNLPEGVTEAQPVSIAEYNHNKWSLNTSARPLQKYLEIEAGDSRPEKVKITVYYSDDEIAAAGLDENTLQIHYYNESSGEWETLPSIVNATGNYVVAEVGHLSVYGIFGEPAASSSGDSGQSSSEASGSGGSGSRRGVAGEETSVSSAGEESGAEIPGVAQPVLQQREKMLTPPGAGAEGEAACNYALELSLPEELSFLEQDSYQLEAVNHGNCGLSFRMELSPPLSEYLTFNVSSLEIPAGNSSSFVLIRSFQSPYDSLLTGSTITTLVTRPATIPGSVYLSVTLPDQTQSRELPLRIVVWEKPRMRLPTVLVLAAIALIGLWYGLRSRWFTGRKQNLKKKTQKRQSWEKTGVVSNRE